jgi:hypothetical protein
MGVCEVVGVGMLEEGVGEREGAGREAVGEREEAGEGEGEVTVERGGGEGYSLVMDRSSIAIALSVSVFVVKSFPFSLPTMSCKNEKSVSTTGGGVSTEDLISNSRILATWREQSIFSELIWTGEEIEGAKFEWRVDTTSAARDAILLLRHISFASRGGAFNLPTISEIATTNSGKGFNLAMVCREATRVLTNCGVAIRV